MSPSPLDPASRALSDYALKVGDDVDVDLLVGTEANGRTQPVTIEGRVVTATSRVLVVERTRRRTRIPWAAVAAIRDTTTTHPAL